jgi:hypothetical protein
MRAKIFVFGALFLFFGNSASSAEVGIELTNRVCFGELHPECSLIEVKNGDGGVKKYTLASTKRGRVVDERHLSLNDFQNLQLAIRRFQALAKRDGDSCRSPVRFQNFKGEELVESTTYCANKSEIKALRSFF